MIFLEKCGYRINLKVFFFILGVDIPGIHLSLPLVHVALSGDLQVQIIASSFPPLLMQLSRLEGNAVRPLTTFPIFPKATEIPNNISVNIPCGYFSREGLYYIVIKKQPIGKSFFNQ